MKQSSSGQKGSLYTVQQHAAESGAFKINLANFKEGNTGTH